MYTSETALPEILSLDVRVRTALRDEIRLSGNRENPGSRVSRSGEGGVRIEVT